jgi:hypothetical protein
MNMSRTKIKASDLNDGIISVASLAATGTASSTTFLRGDNTWGTPIGGVTSVDGLTGAITDANIAAAVESASDSNTFTDADHSKLNNIEASATADQTKADIEGLGIDLPANNLTGTVPAARLSTATTQLESDDSTKIATTAYVVDKITTLIGGAPSTLNDLSELAAAINDDADYNSTLTTALGTKLPKSGGSMTGDVSHGDNVKAKFGASDDLQIYHDGSNSVIEDAVTGGLHLKTNGANIAMFADTELMAVFNKDDGVILYNNNAVKLATTTTGVDVTGTITADGLVVSNAGADSIVRLKAEGGATDIKTWEMRAVGVAGEGLAFRQVNDANSVYTNRVIFDNSGSVLVGTTSDSWTTTAGLVARASGSTSITRDGGTVLNLNRLTSDGEILNLRKNGTTVGSIGTEGGSLAIGGGDTGIGFYQSSDALVPHNTGTNAARDAAINLGMSSARFKDLHLSGTVNADVINGASSVTISSGGTSRFYANSSGFQPNLDNSKDLGWSGERFKDLHLSGTSYVGGNVLVGKTTTAIETVGTSLFATGRIISTADGDDVAVLNRKTSDGDIAVFKKDGTTVGIIGTHSGDFWIGQGNTGLLFNDGGDVIRSANASGGNRDGVCDLGASDSRFKDLYLSGTVNAGSLNVSGTITNNGNVVWNAGNDGAGSGLDADLLDGLQGASFLRSDADDTMTGNLTIDSASDWNAGDGMLNVGGTGDGRIQVRHIWGKDSSTAGTDNLWLNYGNTGYHVQIGASGGGNNLYVSGEIYANGYFGGSQVWHSGNDGAGSGLDADLLDGQQGSYYSNTSHTHNYVPHQDGVRYTTDFNTILTSGFYNAQASPTNSPGGSYGQLIVAKGVDTGMQIYGGYNTGELWFRGWASSGATMYSWNKVWHNNNDGAGSGLDADLLDGINSTGYLRTDISQTISAGQTKFNSATNMSTASGDQARLEVRGSGSGTDAFMTFHVAGDYAAYLGLDGGTNKFSVGGWSMGAVSHALYHEGNKPTLSELGYTGASDANKVLIYNSAGTLLN